MRTVTTILSLKYTFRKFSAEVSTVFGFNMKGNEGTDPAQSSGQTPAPAATTPAAGAAHPATTPAAGAAHPAAPAAAAPAGKPAVAHAGGAAPAQTGAAAPGQAGAAASGQTGGAASGQTGAATSSQAGAATSGQTGAAAVSQAAAAALTHEAVAAAVGADDFTTIKKKIQEFIPRLKQTLHKGECGRIAIFGGSTEYTGAPYFAAMSALKVGADLVHVFCAKESGPIIKSYSPELMVHPCLDTSDGLRNIEPWLERCHALVIGPGLGRTAGAFKSVSHVITFCKKVLRPAPPLVLDADALHLVAEDLNLIKRYPAPVFMTPNSAEFSKLCTRASESNGAKVAMFYSAIIIQKGFVDVISNGLHTNKTTFSDLSLSCSLPGSKKRCGGQGDILAGCLGTFLAWANNHVKSELKFDYTKIDSDDPGQYKPDYLKDIFTFYMAAAYGACAIARTSGKMAFDSKGRGMTASDMIACVDKAFKSQFEL